MTADFKTLAARLRDLQDASKAQIAGVLAQAEEAGLDPAGLRRFVSWKRKDESKRAQQEAIDQQCRYLAGERDTPAQLPVGCELAQALNLFRRGLTVRQVAEELRVSTGKAGKLKQLSRMFDVHVHATVDKMPDHDPETGEIDDPQKPAAVEVLIPARTDERRKTASLMPAAGAWREITTAREASEAARKAALEAERERRRAAQVAFDKRNAEIDADPLTLPPHLDRRQRASA